MPLQAAGLLLSRGLGTAGSGGGRMGIHPVSQAVGRLGAQAVAVAALHALQTASQVGHAAIVLVKC